MGVVEREERDLAPARLELRLLVRQEMRDHPLDRIGIPRRDDGPRSVATEAEKVLTSGAPDWGTMVPRAAI
jgi:hypothetical protein